MLPKLSPSIGTVCAVSITTTDLDSSLSFYEKLGFKEVGRSDFPFPWLQVSDGSLLIMLRLDKNPLCGLTYFVDDIDQVVANLEAKKIGFVIKAGANDMVKRFVLQSPDGLRIALVTNVEGFFRQPEGTTLMNMSPADFSKPDKYPNPLCGVFGELAHPVKNLDDSILFWEKLGYTLLSKKTAPYPWAILSDGLGIIGLHQTDNFNYPAITFFGIGVKQRVESIKAAGIEKIAERSGPNNVVITTPEGQHLFLFSLM